MCVRGLRLRLVIIALHLGRSRERDTDTCPPWLAARLRLFLHGVLQSTGHVFHSGNSLPQLLMRQLACRGYPRAVKNINAIVEQTKHTLME